MTTLRDWLTEASSLLVDVTPARELQAQLAALLVAEEPVTQHLLGIPLRVSRAVPPGQLRLDYRPDRQCGAHDGHSPRVCTLPAGHEGAHHDARFNEQTLTREAASPAAVHDDVPLDRDGLLSEDCPHGHVPETCTACSDARAVESLRQRMRDAEDRADRLHSELRGAQDAHERTQAALAAQFEAWQQEHALRLQADREWRADAERRNGVEQRLQARIKDLHDAAVSQAEARRSDAELLGHLQRQLDAAREALRPFVAFVDMFEAKPLRGLDDTLYGIHTGTPWAAELKLSDCRRARAALLRGGIEGVDDPPSGGPVS